MNSAMLHSSLEQEVMKNAFIVDMEDAAYRAGCYRLDFGQGISKYFCIKTVGFLMAAKYRHPALRVILNIKLNF